MLRRIGADRYYEHFYHEAERMGLPIRLSDGGDFENAEQVRACIATAPAPRSAADASRTARTSDSTK